MNYFYLCLFLVHIVIAEYHLDSNNKFQEILVFINDNVKEANGTLLNRIKDHINNASKSLWKATSHMDKNKGGVQFGTINIRVPETWNIPASPLTWEQCNTALFFVTIDNIDKTEKPLTKQIGKCGEPGNFTRFPESFFRATSQNETFKRGKEFMREFVKLRYGVYSEEPLQNQLQVFNGTKIISAVCGKDIKWNIVKDKNQCLEPNTKCRYEIIKNQRHNHSLMFDSETYTNEYFCDDKYLAHNTKAKNLHNNKCHQKSVTSIILSHKDFESNKTATIFENVKFNIIKAQNRKIVLVLDTSISMEKIIDNMKLATIAFLESLENKTSVGIVEFGSKATILSNLLPIGYATNRQTLITTIKNLKAATTTNIPDGLAKAVEVLDGNISNNDPLYGFIILLTDGQNNQNNPYNYEFVIEQLINKKIPVNAIAYGTQADSNINRITTGTNGKYFYADPNIQYTDLLGKFSFKHSCEISIDQEIKMIDEKIYINLYQKVQSLNLTYIDKYVGVNLKLTMTIPIDKTNYLIMLIDPKKQRFNYIGKVEQQNVVTFNFFIPGSPEIGRYEVEFQSPTYMRYKRDTNAFGLILTVSGIPIQKNERIINPSGDLSSSIINELEDTTSITSTVDLTTCGILTNENVIVMLAIDGPNQVSQEVQMFDDGIGEDAIANDKIFTKVLYARNIKDVGFYNFLGQINITNSLTSEIIKRTVNIGSLRVMKAQNKIEDKIPPAKIENIRAQCDENKKILKIFLTAPGNDGMIGNISDYEFQIRSEQTIFLKKKAYVNPREQVMFELDLMNENVTNPFEISVRGIDDSMNLGEWSDPIPYNWKYDEIVQENNFNNHSVKLQVSLIMLMFFFVSFFLIVHKMSL